LPGWKKGCVERKGSQKEVKTVRTDFRYKEGAAKETDRRENEGQVVMKENLDKDENTTDKKAELRPSGNYRRPRNKALRGLGKSRNGDLRFVRQKGRTKGRKVWPRSKRFLNKIIEHMSPASRGRAPLLIAEGERKLMEGAKNKLS